MAYRNMTSEEFYRLRDQRTVLSLNADVLSSANLRLSINDQEAASFEGQVAFLTLVNLCSRWCRRISIDAPNTQLHPALSPMYTGRLLDTALCIASAADPFGDFSSQSLDTNNKVHVGANGPDGAFQICGRGWLSFAGKGVSGAPRSSNGTNPIGSLLSACIGTAHAMRVAIGDPDLYESSIVSLWNSECGKEAEDGPELSAIELGQVLMVGLGAVGSSMAYVLALLNAKFDAAALVDADIVDFPNLNRSPIFFADDVNEKKVEVVSRVFAMGAATLYPVGIESAVESGLRIDKFDLLVPAANVPSARVTVMSNTPPIMISASTGTQWDAYRQRHIPLQDDCLICRFPLNRPPAPMGCSTGTISPVVEAVEAPPQTGALPFLSLAGAVMAAAEIAKLNFPEAFLRGTNRAILSFRSPEIILAPSHRLPKESCSYCARLEIFKVLGRNGRFAQYSQVA